VTYDPSPVQKEFHSLGVDEALFGGSAGPGKSLTLLMEPLSQIVVEHQRCAAGELKWGRSTGRCLHFRREIPRLEESITRSKMYYPDIDPGARWEEQKHTWTFSSGYKVQFAHMKDADSFMNFRSIQCTMLLFDELIEFERDHYDQMVTRVRSTDPVLRKMLKVRSASNPAPGWVREYFVDPAPQGRVVLRKSLKLNDGSVAERTRIFIPARLSDNPDKEYRRQYEINLQDKPAHIRASLLHGDWYVVAGAFFAEEWDQERHIIKPFRIPRDWRRFRSGDWGYKSPCVILWWAVTPDNELICYRERTYQHKTAVQVAERIKKIEQDAGEWDERRDISRCIGPMDTQLWEERGHTGPSMFSDMSTLGVTWTKANKKSRATNAQNVMTRLKSRGLNGRPGIMFFDNCKGCIETIPAIPTDKSEPEEPLKGGADHHYDAVSYACSHFVMPTEKNESFLDDDDFEDELAQERERRKGQYGYGGY
jgi:hypothetical protein